jgi:hypothetical protein
MDLVSSFVILLQPLAYGMTTPSFGSFVTIVTGWIFAPRRTVSNMLLAASAVGKKHHSSFYRFFSQARWSSDQVGFLLFRLLPLWQGEETIFFGGGRYFGAQARPESLRRGNAPRPAALQPQQGHRQLGT